MIRLARGAFMIGVAVLVASAGAARAQVVQSTWLGGEGDWSDPAQWDSPDYPHNNSGIVYDVVIGSGTVTRGEYVTVDDLTLTGGTLTGDATLWVRHALDWSGGRIAGGTVSADGTVTLGGTLELDGALACNHGATWSGGRIDVGDGAELYQGMYHTFAITGAGVIGGMGSGAVPLFRTFGTLWKEIDSGTTTVEVYLDSIGPILVEGGTLALRAGARLSRSTDYVGPEGRLELSGGTYDLGDWLQVDGVLTIEGATVNSVGNLQGAGEIALLDSEATLNVSPGGLGGEWDSPLRVHVADGTLNLDGGLWADCLELELAGGTLAGTGGLWFGPFTTWRWTGGTVANRGDSRIVYQGQLEITGTAPKYLQGRLDTLGIAVLSGGDLYLGDEAALRTGSSGTFDLQGDANILRSGSGSPTLEGEFTKSAGTGLSTIEAQLVGSSDVRVQTGTVRLTGGGNPSGEFDVAAGSALELYGGVWDLRWCSMVGGGIVRVIDATVQCGGIGTGAELELATSGAVVSISPYRIGGTLTIRAGTANIAPVQYPYVPTHGTVNLVGGRLTGEGSSLLHDLVWTGGRVEISGTLGVYRTGQWSISGQERKVVQGNVLIDSGASAVLSGGTLEQSSGSTFVNQGTFTLGGDTDIACAPGTPAVFDNRGTFEKAAGTGVSQVRHVFHNEGKVVVQTGTLRLTAGGVHTGRFIALPGATIELAGGSHVLNPDTLLATIQAEGTFLISDGTVRVTSPLGGTGAVQVTGGSLELDAFPEPVPPVDLSRLYFVQNGSSLCWFSDLLDGVSSDQQVGLKEPSPGQYLVWYWSGTPYDCAQFIVTLDDMLTVEVPDHLSHEELTGGCGSHHYACFDADGDGTADWNTDDLLIEGKGDDDMRPCGVPGSVSVRLSGWADFRITVSGGTVNFNADGAMRTPVVLEGGRAGGSGAPVFDSLTWTSGTLAIPHSARIAAGGALTISGTGDKHLLCDLVNAGEATWSGGTVRSAGGAALRNRAGGTITLEADAALASADGGAAILTNDGEVCLDRWALAVEGDYRQGPTGLLELALCQGAAGRLDAGGEAALDGTLSITLDDGFVPAVGEEFTVITCGGRSGRFADLDGWLLPGVSLVPVYREDGLLLHATYPADANLDGEVGIADLVALAENYGLGTGADWAAGDFNGDGLVGIADLVALADHYGAGVGGAAVPEPFAFALLAAGILTALRRRRR